MSMKLKDHKQLVFIGSIFAVYIAIITVVSVVQFRGTEKKLNDLMESCVETVTDSVDFNVEPETVRLARLLVSEWGTLERARAADIGAALRRYDLAELNIVDTNGIVVASGDPALVGFDMKSTDETAEFLQLNTGARAYLTQHFRPSKGGATASSWIKFVGLPLEGGGFIQAGESYRDYRRRFSVICERLMQDYGAGATGGYLLVDRSANEILSGFLAEWTGKSLSEAGIDVKRFKNDVDTPLMHVFGTLAFVRRVSFPFADMDAYVIIPRGEIVAERNRAICLVALMLGIVFLIGGTLFCKIIRQHERIEEMHAREAARLEKDMAMARAIQAAALPTRWPQHSAVDLHAMMRTAKQVGGDFYDFFFLSPRRLFIVVADVSDKGVPAAMFMMKAKSVLRAAAEAHEDLCEAVRVANVSLCAGNETSNMFVTAWIACLDLETGRLKYVNAGHNPPFLRRADGSMDCLRDRHGLVLAAADIAKYRSGEILLKKDDTLFLYTDGVTEAASPLGELFGEDRLERVLGGMSGSAQGVCESVVKAVDAYADGAPQADDITVFTLRYLGEG